MSTYDKEKAAQNLKNAVEIAGGVTAIAKKLDMSEQGFRHYMKRGVKSTHVVKICELSCWSVKPVDLRPDVFTGVDRLPAALDRMMQVDTAGKDGYEVKDEMIAVAAAS